MIDLAGVRTLGRLSVRGGPSVPGRDLAAAIVAIVSTIPRVDGDEPSDGGVRGVDVGERVGHEPEAPAITRVA